MLFKLFKAKSTIGCFGKLPIHADFIKLRAENNELSLFDKWAREGMHLANNKLGNNFKEHYNSSLYYNFIFQPKNLDKSIIGTLYPGMDKSGRCFPFVIFLFADKYQIGTNFSMFLNYLEDEFYTKAVNMLNSNWAELEVGEFLKKYFDWEISTNFDQKKYKDNYNNYIKQKTVGDYFEDLPGNLNEEKKFLIIQNLIDVIKPLSKENLSRFSLGIKFDLSPQKRKNKFEVAFWTDLIFKILPTKKIFPSLFWSNNNVSSHLLFYINEPQPKHFLSLLNVNTDIDDSICSLSEMRSSKIDGLKNSMHDKHYSILNSPDTTLHKFLHDIKI